MDLGSFFLILAAGIIVLVLLARPFVAEDAQVKFTQTQQKFSKEEDRLSTLLAERDRILSAVEEIETDYEMGKIPAGAYPQSRTGLLHSGAEILKQIDELTLKNKSDGMDDLEKMIETRREARKTKNAASYCPHCGNALQKNDRFCSGCGKEVSPVEFE